jgi:carbon monoxide dehydrogenase subunit G
MRIEGRFRFEGSQQEVWDLLLDPEELKVALPGVKEWKEVGPYEYEVTMKVGIAAVSGTYSGKMVALDLQEPRAFKLAMEGGGPLGFVKGEGNADLAEESGKTVMSYAGEVEVGGTLAAVGQRMLSGVAKLLIDQGLKTMARRLKERRQTRGVA